MQTPLFSRQQPGGALSVVNVPEHPGNIFYVDSGATAASDAAGFGYNPDAPFATIDYAVSACTASNGDVIYVMPGHAEVVTAAGGLDLDVAGITIIGLGRGASMPTVTLTTAATADVDIDAAGVTVQNVKFVAGFADIAAFFDVNADDFSLIDCVLVASAVDLNAKIWVQDAAAGGSDRITIQGCYVQDRDAANTHFVNFAGTGDGHKVVGNVLHVDCGTMAIGGAGVITNCYIADNIVNNAASDVDSCINLAATATGSVVRNLCAGAAAQANGVTATACLIAENYYGVLAEDLSGILDPIAT